MSILRRIAKALDGAEYPLSVPQEIIESAKQNSVVIVFGASDDLIEFRGSVDDEGSVYEGSTVLIDKDGVLPINQDGTLQDDEPNTVEECRKIVERFDHSTKIEAVWCPDDGSGASWAYNLPDEIQCERFNVMEDGDLYCVGVVFQMDGDNS